MDTNEVWKPVYGFKGYEVSNLGRVRSLDRLIKYGKTHKPHLHRGRVLKLVNGPSGYPTVHLGFKNPHKYVHHLVMRAFAGKTPSGLEICHNDGNRKNNRFDNLRFDTHWSNNFDKERHRYEQAWLNHAKNSIKQQRWRPRTLG